MCRGEFGVLEHHDREKKFLTENSIRRYKKRKADSDIDGRKQKTSRTSEFTCSLGPPPVRGRRKCACRICGYAINPAASNTIKMSCCELLAHAKCLENSACSGKTAAQIKKPVCKRIKNFLCKNQTDERINLVSSSQPVNSVPSPAHNSGVAATQIPNVSRTASPTICKYCNQAIDKLDENHLMQTCPALNKFAEPVSTGSTQLTPYAYRHASMTLLNPSSTTPRRRKKGQG